MSEIGEADAATAAQQVPVPVEVNVPVVPELSLGEKCGRWEWDRTESLGRPKQWNGEPNAFDDFAFKFSKSQDSFLKESVTMVQPIQWATLTAREKAVVRGVADCTAGSESGKALSCIRHLPEKLDGFEMWRLLFREYKPDTTTTTVGLLETVMDDQPAPGTDFGDWFLRWLDLVGE